MQTVKSFISASAHDKKLSLSMCIHQIIIYKKFMNCWRHFSVDIMKFYISVTGEAMKVNFSSYVHPAL